MTTAAPCKCGHRPHWARDCGDCECTAYCPDHVAAAELDGRTPSPADIEVTADLVEQLGWFAPAQSVTQATCCYCVGEFPTCRSHQKTCSDACRTAMSRALRLGSDDDVTPMLLRRESFNEQRRRATGFGLMTRRDQYNADLRVRATAAKAA